MQYFGESGIQTAASADADSDGLTDLQECAFGMNPSQASGGMLRWSGSNLLERGVATPFASGAAGNFTFRALFGRRKDFAATGSSRIWSVVPEPGSSLALLVLLSSGLLTLRREE